ncbi:hypothetical protein O9K51_11216 [Purpureocillium lavendulum]|uniref:Tse2 ADP-ribosyltransferase toxin domain-containing protein n=1 Tax=Purpureocillium lavendulum TaxID=1247861 RepID=A0AB34FB40_9HYPO|nr:hypothetical protein O9K51_11216 [Purpureocillium lavendulum]
MSSRMLGRFSHCPTTLFRLNNGTKIKLRDLAAKARSSYDVQSENGLVLPKALNPLTYSGPNGASMRPLGETQTNLVKSFKGDDMLVWGVPEGTALPDTLILVHEHTDHYSLQPAQQMSVKDLNQELTNFFASNATRYTREQWCRIFEEGWTPHPDNGDYYRYREDGSVEWYSQIQASSSSAQQHGKEQDPWATVSERAIWVAGNLFCQWLREGT